jgi:hypothetical protein
MIKKLNFKSKLIIRLASKSDTVLKRIEDKVKINKKLKKIYSRGSRYYLKPDRLIAREKRKLLAEELLNSEVRRKGTVKEINDDWKGLKAHFKVELEPGIEKSQRIRYLLHKTEKQGPGKTADERNLFETDQRQGVLRPRDQHQHSEEQGHGNRHLQFFQTALSEEIHAQEGLGAAGQPGQLYFIPILEGAVAVEQRAGILRQPAEKRLGHVLLCS